MKKITVYLIIFVMLFSSKIKALEVTAPNQPDTFKYYVEKFADLKILRYQVPGFENLSLRQKKLIYCLNQAALSGRDIIFDQNGKYNLMVRRTLDNIVETYKGNRNCPDFEQFMVYAKRVWFSNGIYHHYSCDKIIPKISRQYFQALVKQSNVQKFPLKKGETMDKFLSRISPVIFDPTIAPKRVSLDPSKDLVQNSACNFYEGVTEKEADHFYKSMVKPNDPTPVSYGLNSKLVKENGHLIEKTWKINGMYGSAISEIVKWLTKALPYAENQEQKATLEKLIEYYKTGNLKTWDDYNILWVKDLKSEVDFTNGFIETYGDPIGLKATWEAIVNFKNLEATHRTEIISSNAQWFEDHSPIDPRFKKKEVKGVSAKVITIAQLGGECYPSTPIGINLPNADWIRKDYGSKSVTLENITYAYNQASLKDGFLEEYAADPTEIKMIKDYGYITDNLHTDLHECLGHGSGQLLPGVKTDALKNYQSTLEEARADLFALYYMADQKMVDLGLLPDAEAYKAQYMSYIRNGLMTQLVRIKPGKNIEEAHMRNRQLIAKWCYEKGKDGNVIEFFTNDGKTYVRINDFDKLRTLFGELLKEVQRIKSEGDYEAGKNLVENYGVQVDEKLHQEVSARYEKLNLAPYGGFINPVFTPLMKNGEITDVKVSYPDNYVQQMLDYSKHYSFLPTYN
ncbi:MAG: dihydrofolate reductase [Bacteroidota bacterium]|nr:dihydrofolate reductase [Bacteroidota bacterium]